MINKWILNNFKSINKEKELEFRPLTIFTGANSSGKSTILQSILLVTQTLQDSIPSRSIVLNGWFKKFGSYDDVVNHRDFNKDITIGFDISGEMPMVSRRTYGPWMEEIKSVDCSFIVSSNRCKEDLLPYLRELKLITTDIRDKQTILRLSKINEPSKEIKKVLDSVNENIQQGELDYKVEANFENNRRFYNRNVQSKFIGVGLSHFLPNYLLFYYNRIDRMKDHLLDALMGGREMYTDMLDSIDGTLNHALTQKGMEIADAINNTLEKKTKNFERIYERIKKDFTFQLLVRLFDASRISDMDKMLYVNQLQDVLSKLPVQYAIDRMPMYYQPGGEYVKSFFSEHIKYLGPLREEPKSLYPLEGSGSASDLGLKGENTAAVLENNKNELIHYVAPSFFEKPISTKPEVTIGTLAEAINKWLVYLGVASDMSTNDKGKFGHELKITTEIKDMQQDLTHVGVGVSQILPILVLCFLAEKGDSIILEQPELHLHPKVQTRLADFFVSMNALGKQCIIETHSEYLINRLRLLVVKSDDTKVADETMIYFVEKDQTEGFSKYREITINPYGKIDRWPEGFFDEGENLSSQIVEAAFEKRRREKQKSGK